MCMISNLYQRMSFRLGLPGLMDVRVYEPTRILSAWLYQEAACEQLQAHSLALKHGMGSHDLHSQVLQKSQSSEPVCGVKKAYFNTYSRVYESMFVRGGF